jgi:hypothetical protein
MATVTFTFETGAIALNDLNNMMALEFGYQDTVPDPVTEGQTIPNPETKAQFNKRNIGRQIKEAYYRQKRIEAERAAGSAVPVPPDFE